MKKLILSILLFSVVAVFGLFAQFAQLESDFSKLMLLLGREVMPHVQQNDLAGTGIGGASLAGDFFYVGLTAGAVVSDGVLKFVDKNNTEFTTLDVYGLIDDAVPDSGIGRDLYDKSKDMFPFPTVKLAFGLRIIGYDFIFTGVGVPGGIISTDDLEASLVNLGFRMRRELLKEQGFFPTISLGVGYVYSNVHFKYILKDFEQDFSDQTLTISGGLSLDTTAHSIGFDVGISRTLLILTPFLRTSLWYQNTSYETNGSLTAKLGSGTSQDFSPSAKVSINDWAVMFAGGLDINLFLLQLCTTGTYNPSTKAWGAEVSLRFGF
ncbi:MAG: hypothetical protein SNJ78_11885 [Spirochaetales bacterium]